jgi:hypothetical protein
VVKCYVALDLRLSILPDWAECQSLWVDFAGEAAPRICYLLTPELYLRVEAKLAALAQRVDRGEAARESYAVANGRFLALREAISLQGGLGAVEAARGAWGAKIAAGQLPPLPPDPPLANFPNFNQWEHGKFTEWLSTFLMTKAVG